MARSCAGAAEAATGMDLDGDGRVAGAPGGAQPAGAAAAFETAFASGGSALDPIPHG